MRRSLTHRTPYDEDLAQEICERISAGELLIEICNELHMPTVRRCNQWLKDELTSMHYSKVNP